MKDEIPFLLHEAVLTLYPSTTGDEPDLANPIWQAVTNQMTVEDRYAGPVLAASGAAYETHHVTHKETELRLERTWLLRRTSLAEFVPQPATEYALDCVWESEGVWYRRMFYKVTPQMVNWNSRGVLAFSRNEQWRCANWADFGGAGRPPVYTPLTPPSADSTIPAGWFRETPLIVGEYLLGQYRWADPVTLTGVRVVGVAGQGAATVLRLELDGVPTSTTVTLPMGSVGEVVSADAGLDVAVDSGVAVRWLIDSGPGPENAAYGVALMADVSLSSDAFSVSWFRESPLIEGEALLGQYRWTVPIVLGSVRIVGVAGQGADTVLRLELGGAPTGTTVTIPMGSLGEVVTMNADLNVAVGSGLAVRWLIDSGPGPENAAYAVAVLAEVEFAG